MMCSEETSRCDAVFVVGDVHGKFDELVKLMKSFPDGATVIQVGDMGMTQRAAYLVSECIRQSGQMLRFLDGNHEHFDWLEQLNGSIYGTCGIKIHDNVIYQPRGSVAVLPNNLKAVFVGGARSVNKEAIKTFVANGRKLGWYAQEDIDIDRLPSLPKADVVFSHTLPRSSGVDDIFRSRSIVAPYGWNLDEEDVNERVLDFVRRQADPQEWYAGHWHRYMQFREGSTSFHLLDAVRTVYRDGNLPFERMV